MIKPQTYAEDLKKQFDKETPEQRLFVSFNEAARFYAQLGIRNKTSKRDSSTLTPSSKIPSPVKKNKSSDLETIITPPRRLKTSSDSVHSSHTAFDGTPIKQENLGEVCFKPEGADEEHLESPSEITYESTNETNESITHPVNTSVSRFLQVIKKEEAVVPNKNDHGQFDAANKQESTKTNPFMKNESNDSTQDTPSSDETNFDSFFKNPEFMNQMKASFTTTKKELSTEGELIFYEFPTLPLGKSNFSVLAVTMSGKETFSSYWLFKADKMLDILKNGTTYMYQKAPYHGGIENQKFYNMLQYAYTGTFRAKVYGESNETGGAVAKGTGRKNEYSLIWVLTDDVELTKKGFAKRMRVQALIEAYVFQFNVYPKLQSYLNKPEFQRNMSQISIKTAKSMKLEALNGLFVDNDIKRIINIMYDKNMLQKKSVIDHIWKNGNIPEDFDWSDII